MSRSLSFPMPNSTPASQSIVTTKKECPLCASKSRPYIDTVIMELRDAMPNSTNGNGNHRDRDVVDAEVVRDNEDENGGTDANPQGMTYTRIEQAVRELLTKLNDSTEFTYADLLVHAGEHTLVTRLAGVKVRTEGNYLIVGEEVFQRVDPKDALAVGISVGLQQLLSGQMKLSAPAWVNMQALLWRMMGNSNSNEFIDAMIEKTRSMGMDIDSPLGISFRERQEKLAQNKSPQNNSSQGESETA